VKALLRGFLTGFGFALGASVAGTLIGYTIGRIGEASVKRLLSPEPTPSPAPSSDESRPMTMTEAALYRPDDHTYLRKEFVGHCMYEVAPGTVCGWDEAAHHKSNYGVPETCLCRGSEDPHQLYSYGCMGPLQPNAELQEADDK
jgi:hypothetical protein